MIARAWAWIDAFFNPPPIRRGVPGWREDRLERFWICGETNDHMRRDAISPLPTAPGSTQMPEGQ